MLKRLLGPAAITACTIAFTASTASAATFRAEQGGAGSACTPAAPCGTIDAALAAARSSAGPDTLQIGPGVWNDQIVLDGRDSGLEVVGAGSGADAASSTILRGTGDLVRLIAGADGAPGMTVRKLRLEGSGSYTDRLLSVGASGSHFDDVTVTGDLRPGTMAIGAGVDTTFDHLNVSVFSGGALRVDGGQVAVRDSSLSSLPADTVDTPTASAAESSTLSFVRSRVVAATGSFSAIATSGALRVDSSTVTGGCRAAIDHDPALPRAATVSNSTVDVGEAGFTDTDEVSSYCGTPSSLIERGAGTMNVRSSIVLEPVRGDAGTILCRWSSVPLLSRPASAQAGAVDCGAAGHNGAPAAPGALFRDATHLDYRLVANAPVVDAGDPAPLVAGESATDRDGNPRISQPGSACGNSARRDQGAFESPARCLPRPPVTKPADHSAPALRSVKLAPRAATPRRLPRLTFSVNEAATVRIAVRRGKTALRGSARVKAGRVSLDLRRVLHRKGLARGRYALEVVATDGAGNRSRAARLALVSR